MHGENELTAFDRTHVWHPYAPIPAPVDPLVVESAQGVVLTLADGRRLIDGMSSWWAAAHGHRHPALVQAAHQQIDTLPHVMFGGLTHRPAVDLARRLVDITPEGLDCVFYSDSGSVSVEVAIKMALQYQRAMGHPERTKLLTWRSGYHGDTYGAMSVCDPEGGMHTLWRGTLAEQKFAPAPPVHPDFYLTPVGGQPSIQDYLADFDRHIDESVAAIIVEPVVQGAGGMRLSDPALLRGLRQCADAHGVVLIFDEIATGFGRTGKLFAANWADVSPDIMCVGKALTGGMISFAATLASRAIAEAVSSPQGGGALMHGPTFMGNPTAAAISLAALDVVDSGYWQTTVPRIEHELRQGLSGLVTHPAVASVRVLGAIGVVETVKPVDMAAATAAAVSQGVWLRPFGRLVYTMPPLISTTEDIQAICRAIGAVADTLRSNQ